MAKPKKRGVRQVSNGEQLGRGLRKQKYGPGLPWFADPSKKSRYDRLCGPVTVTKIEDQEAGGEG